MHLKRLAMALAAALLLSGFVTPGGTAHAAGGETTMRPPPTVSDAPHDDHEEAGDGAEDPDEGAEPGDTLSDSHGSDDPADHDDSGDGDSGDGGRCAVAAGPVAVCLDQPR